MHDEHYSYLFRAALLMGDYIKKSLCIAFQSEQGGRVFWREHLLAHSVILNPLLWHSFMKEMGILL